MRREAAASTFFSVVALWYSESSDRVLWLDFVNLDLESQIAETWHGGGPFWLISSLRKHT